MSDTSEPTPLTWDTAPEQFRQAHDKSVNDLRAVIDERAKLEREIAMLRAGVDAQHPAFPYFNAGYNGKLDADDIKAEWAKIVGSMTPPQPPEGGGSEGGQQPLPDDGSNPEVAEAMRRLQEERTRLGTGATAPGEEPSPDPNIEQVKIYHDARRQGDQRIPAMRKGLQHLFNAAVAGDERVVSSSAAENMRKWKARHGEDV